MEAATPLRSPRVHVLMGRVIVENVVIDDPTTAAFLDRRMSAGDDPVAIVNDAIEVGARVLEREQAAVDAEFVRNEFEKVSREVESAFTDKARVVAEFFGTKVDEVFGEENGHLARELQRLFGEGSTSAVQHQLREVMRDQSARMREDLLRQFSSADGNNPLADFKAAHLRSAREMATRQEVQLEAMREQMVALKLELAGLRSEREKAADVAAEHARGTAKGRPYEEALADAIDAIARAQGDDCGRGRRLPRRRRPQGRRRRGHRGLLRGLARPDRLRGQELAALAQGSAVGPGSGDGPPRRRLRHLGRPVRRAAARRASMACARSAATRCSSSTTPRTAPGWPWRSRTPWPERAC